MIPWHVRYAFPLFVGGPLTLAFAALWLFQARPAAQAAERRWRATMRAREQAALSAALDDMEARALALAARPAPECDRVMVEARRFQKGAVVFVKGDHCQMVREGAPRKRRR